MTTVLAIDQRVARTTAAVIDDAGKVLGSSERTLNLHPLPGGGAEQVPREVLGSVVKHVMPLMQVTGEFVTEASGSMSRERDSECDDIDSGRRGGDRTPKQRGGATTLTRLRVDGRLTSCRTLMQSLADLMQIDVEVHSSVNAAALGATAVARIATDPTLGLAEAITPSSPSSVFTPRWSSDQADDFRSRWVEVAEAPDGAGQLATQMERR